MAKKTGEMTPLMRQYWDIKSAHQDKILLFRMGDFFEIFHDDAQIAAPLLGIALTVRNKKSGDQTPMCGVPHHSVAGPINKLLAAGYKVAICDQVEDPAEAKGIVKRAVTRILSPGMVYDPDTLAADQLNYIASFDESSVAFLEPTTGEFFYYQYQSSTQLKKILSTLSPVEIVLAKEQELPLALATTKTDHSDLYLRADETLLSQQRLLSYAIHMQGEAILQTITVCEERSFEERLHLGGDVLRHLEIFKTYKGETSGTLYETIDKTQTAGGRRRLKQWLLFPLMDVKKIESRYEQIHQWLQDVGRLKNLRGTLRGIGDFERKLGKISQPNTHPRDVISLSQSFSQLAELLKEFPEQNKSTEFLSQWSARIDQTLQEDIPLSFRESGFIKRGVLPELDELIELSTNSQGQVLKLEEEEKQKTQISSLKIRYNSVFGYYIEVTHTHSSKVPLDRYQRKQTLTNAERYTTDELVALERKVITARTRRAEVEMEIYLQLKQELLNDMSSFLQLAHFCNELDVITSLAWLALEKDYCRPQLMGEQKLSLKSSRHPVVESKVSFVANDVHLSAGEALLLTGPNMAGKSTIMRQVALISILAQMGSYVPAEQAQLPIFDRIFTRIGASDFLGEGLSTFMVEMTEAAEMLKESTHRSLVVLDEVGRGTSTYDGLSLAQSLLEYLLNHKKPLVFFATHYHELTSLTSSYSQLKIAHMMIVERQEKLQFLYTLKPGSAQKSYGIQVAQLAGMPDEVIARAKSLLKQLEAQRAVGCADVHQMSLWSVPAGFVDESGGVDGVRSTSTLSQTSCESQVMSPEVEMAQKLLADMKTTSISSLTPLAALNKIAEWQKDLGLDTL